MPMLALPIARRELLVLSRATNTWKSRLGTSAMVFVFGIIFAVTYHYGGQIALTRVMHLVGASLSLCCLFIGVSLTADAIAQEKREGTIGLLLLTNLSPFEIVLGKLIAHSVLGFYTVFCALPVLSMTMIYGGMRFTDVLMYLLAALNVLFFSTAVGLFASSFCRDKRRASALGTLLLMFFWMGVPGLVLLLFRSPGAAFSFTLTPVLGMGFQGLAPSSSRGWSMAWTHLLAWAMIGLAVLCLRYRWQDEPPRKKRGLRDIWNAFSLGTPAVRLKLRRKLLDRNAFMWLASRDRLQALNVWIGTCAVLAIFGFNFLQRAFPPELIIVMAFALAAVQEMTLSAAAGVQLAREYEQGTLEMILSTPLSTQEVIDGQLAAGRRYYRSAFALTFVLFWAGVVFLIWKYGPAKLLGVTVLIISSALFVLQFYALGWVGMLFVVSGPNPRQAGMGGFFALTVLPGIVFGLIAVSAQLVTWLLGSTFSPGPELWLPLLFILAFGNCIWWLRHAKRELPEQLRLFAFRRYAQPERQTFFGRLGRFVGRWLHRVRTPSRGVGRA